MQIPKFTWKRAVILAVIIAVLWILYRAVRANKLGIPLTSAFAPALLGQSVDKLASKMETITFDDSDVDVITGG
jgi:hypothetical protein